MKKLAGIWRRPPLHELGALVGSGFDQAVVSGANLAIAIILARQLGAEGFGVWAVLWILVYIGEAFHSALIVSPLQIFFHEKRQVGDARFVDAMFTLHLGLVGAFFAIICALYAVASLSSLLPVAEFVLISVALVGVPFLFSELIRKLLFLIGRDRLAVVLDVGRYGTIVSALILFFAAGGAEDDLLTAVWISAAANAVAAAIGCLATGCRPCADPDTVVRVARESWSYSRWLVPLVVSQRIGFDMIYAVVGVTLGVGAVGGLRAMHQILGVANVYLQALQNVVPGALVRTLTRDGLDAMIRYLRLLIALSIALSALLLAAVAYDPDGLVTVIYGDDFAAFAPALQLMSIGYAALIVGYPSMFALQALKNSKSIAIGNCFGALLSVALAYPLSLKFGVIGAAISFTAYFSIEALYFVIAARRSLGQPGTVSGDAAA